jgi:hypothetical protein
MARGAPSSNVRQNVIAAPSVPSIIATRGEADTRDSAVPLRGISMSALPPPLPLPLPTRFEETCVLFGEGSDRGELDSPNEARRSPRRDRG